jgi:deoxyribodipyrimidine photo-lyase
VLSPLRQATRFDAAGDYVRRYVPELAGLDAVAIRRPWTLPENQRHGYPAPIVEI